MQRFVILPRRQAGGKKKPKRRAPVRRRVVRKRVVHRRAPVRRAPHIIKEAVAVVPEAVVAAKPAIVPVPVVSQPAMIHNSAAGVKDIVSHVLDRGLISKGLRKVGFTNWADKAAQYGFGYPSRMIYGAGRKRKGTTKRRVVRRVVKRKVAKKRVVRRVVKRKGAKKSRVQRGKGFFGDVWNGIKKAANWVKDNGIISKGLSLAPGPIGSIGSSVARQLGLGHRYMHRPQYGGAKPHMGAGLGSPFAF